MQVTASLIFSLDREIHIFARTVKLKCRKMKFCPKTPQN